jgi:hypothetical protein
VQYFKKALIGLEALSTMRVIAKVKPLSNRLAHLSQMSAGIRVPARLEAPMAGRPYWSGQFKSLAGVLRHSALPGHELSER